MCEFTSSRITAKNVNVNGVSLINQEWRKKEGIMTTTNSTVFVYWICLHFIKKDEKQKYHTVVTVPKSNIKIVEMCKIDTPKHTRIWPLTSWLGTGTWIKHVGELILLYGPKPPLSVKWCGHANAFHLWNEEGLPL